LQNNAQTREHVHTPEAQQYIIIIILGWY